MTNNVKMVQKQLKAFNKALSRTDKSGALSDNYYAAIMELIDYERMTKGGYAKAGTKYLESMTPEELLAYSADIEHARSLVDLSNLTFKLDVEDAKDYKSLLWKLYDKMIENKNIIPFDSDQVRDVAEGYTKLNPKDYAFMMYKYINDPNYTQADADEDFNRLSGLEV